MAQWEDRWGIPHDYDQSKKTRTRSGFIYRGMRIDGRIGILGTLIFIAVRVHKMVSQKKLGIAQSIPGQIVSTVIISALYILSVLRTREHDTMVEEIMENCAREKEEAGTGSQAGSQN